MPIYRKKGAKPNSGMEGSLFSEVSNAVSPLIKNGLKKPIRTQAEAFTPGVLQKISIDKPNKNDVQITIFLFVSTGNFTIKYM